MKSRREDIRGYRAEHPDCDIATVAAALGVHRATVYRALHCDTATPASAPTATLRQAETSLADGIPPGWVTLSVHADALSPAALPDGFYQVQDGTPYRIACTPGDVFHVDDDGVLQPGAGRRSVLIRRES